MMPLGGLTVSVVTPLGELFVVTPMVHVLVIVLVLLGQSMA